MQRALSELQVRGTSRSRHGSAALARQVRAPEVKGPDMQPRNLPPINARYWTAILAASMCGANTGDFASRILGLRHTRGLLPLGLLFLAIVWAERRSKVAT